MNHMAWFHDGLSDGLQIAEGILRKYPMQEALKKIGELKTYYDKCNFALSFGEELPKAPEWFDYTDYL